jgi:uncharacterized protein (DUF2147 family)
MPHANLGVLLAGCAAVAVGIVGGWTALALMPTRAPLIELSETISTRDPSVRAPSPIGAEERPTVRPAPSPSLPPASATEKPAAASGPTGVWIDHTGRGAVEISECAGGLCGRIVWLKDAGNKSVCGTQVIGNAKRTSSGTWDGGWIYDPEKNARYSVELKPIGSDKLRVVGYMGSKLFSETFTWKRPTADLKRCEAPAVTASPSPAAGDPKAAPAEITKAEPTRDQPSEPAPANKDRKSGNPSIADIEKIAREMMKGKVGGKECTVKMPYVGNVKVPCQG